MADTNDWNARIIEEFRQNEGRVGGQFEGAPMLLLTTTGRKTAAPRTNPMMYLADGDRLFVFASKAGAPAHPHWYLNLTAHPQVTVEVGTQTFQANAVALDGSERDRVYDEQASRYPGFAEYQQKTTRTIPVVELVRQA